VFFEPGHTQFDLNFSLFGIHVRIHPGFWIMSLILGWSTVKLGLAFLAIWVACVFVSILVHELGHVLVGLLFGSRGNIILYSFGGLAVGSSQVPHRWQRIAVLLGGPGAGFVLAGLVWSIRQFGLLPLTGDPRVTLYLVVTTIFLLEINIGWGIMNLLPVFPLDGGQISRELWEWGSRRHGFVYCLRLSIAVAAVIAIHSLISYLSERPGSPFTNYPLRELPGDLWTAILFGSLAAGSYQTLVAHRQMNEHWDDKYDEWERDERDQWQK
jgi:Zn-dependent protease